jgi:hypothetical protein
MMSAVRASRLLNITKEKSVDGSAGPQIGFLLKNHFATNHFVENRKNSPA